MNPREYLRALRRRWADIVLAVIVALGAGWLITGVAPPGPPATLYEATSVLVNTQGPYATTTMNLSTLGELVKVGDVPERVAQRLGHDGDPQVLAAAVEVEVVDQAAVLKITSRSASAREATRLADAFAEELVAFLGETRAEGVARQTQSMADRLELLRGDIERLDRRIARAGPGNLTLLQAERDAQIRQYGLLYESYQQLALASQNPGGLDIIQAASPLEVSAGGIRPPSSRLSRMVLAGLLGLASGVIIVLLLDRFDTRIRNRQQAERHFRMPVLAEVPLQRLHGRARDMVVTVSDPRSPASDAYRILAAILSMPSPGAGGNGEPAVSGDGAGTTASGDGSSPNGRPRRSPPRRILVTSPGPGDGKTTVVANLAAALSFRERRCLVLSCDLRRPRIHRLLRVSNHPGLVLALERRDDGPVLDGAVRATFLPGVRVAPSGPAVQDPSEILGSARMGRALEEAEDQADVVLLDTAPLLTTSDAANLVGQVDAVIVVARAGRTRAEVAERSAELLGRLGAPVIGVVLNGASEMAVPRRYYYGGYRRRSREPREFSGLARQ